MRTKFLWLIVPFIAIGAIGYFNRDRFESFWSNDDPPDNASDIYGVEYAKRIEARKAEAREKLAFVSIVDRLPKGKSIPPRKPLDDEAKRRWAEHDKWCADGRDERVKVLQAYHARATKFFVNSTGNGAERRQTPETTLMMPYRSERDLTKQSGPPATFPVSPGEDVKSMPPNRDFFEGHDANLRQFFGYGAFGWFKSRDRVSGFVSHGFAYYDAHECFSNQKLRVEHVQLVGILRHEHPVVYLTDKMPSMEQLKQGLTRPLDYFEDAGLSALKNGADLHIVAKGDTLRMLGALRATATCLKCHDAEVGDLLGAFSYTLRPSPESDQGKDAPASQTK